MTTDKKASSAALLRRSRGTTAEGRLMLFYQKGHLVTERAEKGNRHILRAHDIVMAQLEQVKAARILQVDQAGSVLGRAPNTMAYSPYGHLDAEKLTALLAFNGQRFDLIMKDYALGNGYRIYSPALARFYSSDTLSPFGKGGLNTYSYCEGDPVNRNDPSGHFSLKPFKNLFSGRRKNKIRRITEYRDTVKEYNSLENPRRINGEIDFLKLSRNRKAIDSNRLPQRPRLSHKDTAYAEKHNIPLPTVDRIAMDYMDTSKELIANNSYILNKIDAAIKNPAIHEIKDFNFTDYMDSIKIRDIRDNPFERRPLQRDWYSKGYQDS
ncbi:RHS repeat-associated core domain-containing protein [Pseudomonas vlassakiae]|uniref:RHS repeat-associated core domain-containing protein n=1 Tax=Pseudomonas vlassakiae TaxID=485888 RepID=A0A923GJA7_9PSED|nr:RHS repeat-associated core domain-containing protein [Pseudomonas vlassakiae]MBV4542716.1 RHS repeat-associated core domain-containing protein [Pseudomonas vlassakiae]